MYIKYVEYPD